MLTEFVESDVHQFDGVQRIPSFPGRYGTVGALPVEVELGGDQGVLPKTVVSSKVAADVGVKDDVDIVEISIPDKIGTTDQLLFCGSSKNLESAFQLILFKDGFHGKGSSDHDCCVDIVPFGVPWSSFHQRRVIGDGRSLGIAGRRVKLSVNGDYWPAGTSKWPGRPGAFPRALVQP